jgi:CRISPR-associated protein Csd1
MILQALNDYYRRKCDDPDPAQHLPSFGLEQKEVPFLLEITAAGELVQLLDTRTPNGKKKIAQSFRVPQGVKRTVDVAANLLWDTLEYVLGVDTKGKPERVVKQHTVFRQRIATLPPSAQEDAGIQAVQRFFARMAADKTAMMEALERESAWADALESNAVLSFRLHGDVNLVCQRPAVIQAALNAPASADERLAMCLVTGEQAPVERVHTAIKGVWDKPGAMALKNIVSFNAHAFESYGKTERQGENAPVSKAVAFAYTTALNHLLRKNSPQRIQIGDASTVFWADKATDLETAVPDIFGDHLSDDPDASAKAVQSLLSAVHKEHGPATDEALADNRFHILGLAPNAARISIRFYYCLRLPELGKRIEQHFKDLEMVRSVHGHDPQYPSLKRLLQTVCLATSSQPFGDIDRLPPNLGGAIVDAIFAGENVPYPALWLNAAVGRCRAEQAKKTQLGTQAQNVPYARAAVIKACLNRQIRRANLSAPEHLLEKEFLPMLDRTNINPGYLLGRLFAVLERIQETAAGGGGKLNSTIRDKYYGAMASSPGIVFPTLDKLKIAHLKKLPWGQKEWFDKLVGEILSDLPDIPRQLSLPDQGRFALGYYHQRQDFFSKKPDDSTKTEGASA